MSATTTEYGDLLDLSQTEPVPMARLVRVELRKMVDTRAGMWLMISIAAVTALVLLIQTWVAAAQDLHLAYDDYLTSMSIPMGLLLPILGIMSVTSEWGQRTALVTFTLEPRRSRTVVAKLVCSVLLATAAVLVALVLGVLGNLLYSVFAGEGPVWNSSIDLVLGFFLLQLLGLLTGFALGMLLLNTAGAIVAYFVYSFVLPGLFEWGSATMNWLHDLRPWIDFNFAQGPLADASMTGRNWAELAVSGLFWFVLPLSAGLWRMLRAEVK
jgi:ABC-type transport system involved in multi-copper enzyme maturation permease subunit